MKTTKLERLQAQLAQKEVELKRELARVKKEEETRETRRKILAGAAVLYEASQNQEFQTWLKELLERFITRPHERALFGMGPKAAGGEMNGTHHPAAKGAAERQQPIVEPEQASVPA
jgi:hypothetical protein